MIGWILVWGGCTPVTFNKLLGNGKQTGYAVEQTADGGYVLAGDDYSSSPGNEPFGWVVKTDATGNEQWQRSFSGDGLVQLLHVHQTTNGGYVVAGRTAASSAASYRFYLANLDSLGNLLSDETFEGDGDAVLAGADATSDGGTILTGQSGASYDSLAPYVVKADSDGTLEWQKTYTPTRPSGGQSVWQTTDGGYILGFADRSNAKVDALGNVEWQTPAAADDVSGPRPTSDGGYMLTGCVGPWPNQDAALAKADGAGQRVWTQGFGGSKAECSTVGQETRDGGYVIAGDTTSFGAGGNDAYVVKTDSAGGLVWQVTFGGTGHDLATDIEQTTDDGYVVVGRISGGSFGTTGTYTELVKTDADGNAPSTP